MPEQQYLLLNVILDMRHVVCHVLYSKVVLKVNMCFEQDENPNDELVNKQSGLEELLCA